MLNSTILLASEPRGIFLEGIINTASYPGTIMQIVAGTAPVNGEFTWQPYNPSADGDPRMWAVLLEDKLQGFSYASAYNVGQKCFLYVPISGEMINVMAAPEVGTGSANAFTIGERMQVQHGTGLLIPQNTSANNSPFMCLEHIDLTPNVQGLIWCMRT